MYLFLNGRALNQWIRAPLRPGCFLQEKKTMRDLLFKNLTSTDNHRKVLSSSEIVDKEGIRTIVHRHFVYFVREMDKQPETLEQPYLSVIKERNTKLRYERFYCRMKGTLVVKRNEKIYKINFMHSLKICLNTIGDGMMKYQASEES